MAAPVLPAPAPQSAKPGQPVPDAPATDYDPMMEAGRSIPRASMAETSPILPPGAADMDVPALLALLEAHTGRSKAEARVGAMQVLAERDAAAAEQWTDLPPLAPAAFVQLIEAVMADVLSAGSQKDMAA